MPKIRLLKRLLARAQGKDFFTFICFNCHKQHSMMLNRKKDQYWFKIRNFNFFIFFKDKMNAIKSEGNLRLLYDEFSLFDAAGYHDKKDNGNCDVKRCRYLKT
jgi:hypothetical protein